MEQVLTTDLEKECESEREVLCQGWGKLGPKNNIIIIIRETVGKRKQALSFSLKRLCECERVDTPQQTTNRERPVHTQFGCKTLKNQKGVQIQKVKREAMEKRGAVGHKRDHKKGGGSGGVV